MKIIFTFNKDLVHVSLIPEDKRDEACIAIALASDDHAIIGAEGNGMFIEAKARKLNE